MRKTPSIKRNKNAHNTMASSPPMDRALINPLHGGGVEDDSSTETQQKSAQRVLRNFHVLAAAFSLNHGCVTALVALAASELGSSLGNTTLFILYAFYTLSAAFLSNGLVARAGAKRTLVLSLGAYCVYVASYACLLYTSPSPRDKRQSRMPSSA